MKIKAEEPKFGDDEIPAPQNVNYTQGPGQQNTWNQPETNTEPAQPAPAPYTPPARPAPAPYTPPAAPAPYTPPPAPAPSADTPPVQAGIGGGAILIGLLALVGGVYALMDHNTKTAPGGR